MYYATKIMDLAKHYVGCDTPFVHMSKPVETDIFLRKEISQLTWNWAEEVRIYARKTWAIESTVESCFCFLVCFFLEKGTFMAGTYSLFLLLRHGWKRTLMAFLISEDVMSDDISQSNKLKRLLQSTLPRDSTNSVSEFSNHTYGWKESYSNECSLVNMIHNSLSRKLFSVRDAYPLRENTHENKNPEHWGPTIKGSTHVNKFHHTLYKRHFSPILTQSHVLLRLYIMTFPQQHI